MAHEPYKIRSATTQTVMQNWLAITNFLSQYAEYWEIKCCCQRNMNVKDEVMHNSEQ